MIRPAPLLAGLVALAALACGGSSATPDLSGTWHYSSNIPGSGTSMTLVKSGNSISGSGETEVEAGAARPFTVSGAFTIGHQGDPDTQFGLFIAYDAGTQASYAGVYSPPDTLSGTWTESGSSSSRTFTRQP